MLAANASLLDRIVGLLSSKASAPRDSSDVERLLALGVPRVQDLRNVVRSDAMERGRAKGKRPIGQVTALCLHQTATDALAPDHPRLTAIPAHDLVHEDGTITLLHDMQDVVWHGHALNRFSVGIEIVCREPGVAGLERSFWRRPSERAAGKTMADLVAPMTEVQAWSAIALCRGHAGEITLRGGKLEMVVAHRQGHRSRTSDPGSRVWQMVAEPVRKQLGLADASARTWGSGKPLPDAWCGAQRGVAYA